MSKLSFEEALEEIRAAEKEQGIEYRKKQEEEKKQNNIVLKCFRTTCNSPASPLGWNSVTNGLYCIPCAVLIDRNNSPNNKFFPLISRENNKAVRSAPTGKYDGQIILIANLQLTKVE